MLRLLFVFMFVGMAVVHIANTKTVSTNRAHHPEESQAQFDREVLFNDEDVDDDAVFKLSIGEQKKRLKGLIEKKVDANGDGLVDRSELEAWTLKALNDFETEDTRAEFPGIDKDNDGYIAWNEYSSDSYGDDFTEDTEDFQDPDTDEWTNFVKSYKRDKALFHAADHNQDGKLDKQEFVHFKHPRMHPDTKAVLLEDVLTNSDADGDGAINLKEFLGDHQQKANEGDPEWEILETDKFREDLDKDKDGMLKGDEVVRWIASDNKEEAAEEADHLIGECDTNGDDKLSVSEILNNHELWLESDATDYGRQLLGRHDEL